MVLEQGDLAVGSNSSNRLSLCPSFSSAPCLCGDNMTRRPILSATPEKKGSFSPGFQPHLSTEPILPGPGYPPVLEAIPAARGREWLVRKGRSEVISPGSIGTDNGPGMVAHWTGYIFGRQNNWRPLWVIMSETLGLKQGQLGSKKMDDQWVGHPLMVLG